MGWVIMDSSMCVAMMTGRPMARQVRTARRWMTGSSCSGNDPQGAGGRASRGALRDRGLSGAEPSAAGAVRAGSGVVAEREPGVRGGW